VHTTRSSVERLLARAQDEDASIAQLAWLDWYRKDVSRLLDGPQALGGSRSLARREKPRHLGSIRGAAGRASGGSLSLTSVRPRPPTRPGHAPVLPAMALDRKCEDRLVDMHPHSCAKRTGRRRISNVVARCPRATLSRAAGSAVRRDR